MDRLGVFFWNFNIIFTTLIFFWLNITFRFYFHLLCIMWDSTFFSVQSGPNFYNFVQFSLFP